MNSIFNHSIVGKMRRSEGSSARYNVWDWSMESLEVVLHRGVFSKIAYFEVLGFFSLGNTESAPLVRAIKRLFSPENKTDVIPNLLYSNYDTTTACL